MKTNEHTLVKVQSLLETTLNTRELGGYRTEDGKYTRCNMLLRSDEQKHLNEGDAAFLLEKKITTIIDMRDKKAVKKSPSPFIGMAQFCYYNVPIEEGSGVPGSVDAVPASYMKIAGAVNINQVFKHIAHAPDGVLFHCAAGKDRTGVVSAILLLLAKVSEKDIIENYMLTKQYNRKRFALVRKNYPGIDINIVIPQEKNMVWFLQLFREKYGSVEHYLHSIGILPEEIQALKNKLRNEENEMKQAQFFYQSDNAPKPNRPNHIGVAILIEYDNKLLLEHRMDSERWAMIGGGLEMNESLMECATREVLEETAIRLQENMLHFYKVYDDPSRIISYPDGNVLRSISVVYKVHLENKPELICSAESKELYFFDKEELEKVKIAETHIPILRDYLKEGSG